MGKYRRKMPCWSTSELDLLWGTSKKNKEILLLLVVCTEWGKKQTVLCDLQVVNANLKQIIFDSHALQMPKCNVVVLQHGRCTTPPNKGLRHCNPSIEYSTEMFYTESAHGNHDSITYNTGINTTYYFIQCTLCVKVICIWLHLFVCLFVCVCVCVCVYDKKRLFT